MHELREKRSVDEILQRLDELQKADIQAMKPKRLLTLGRKSCHHQYSLSAPQ